MWWSAYIEAASDKAENPVEVEQLEQLADLLEPFSASVGGGGDHYSARLSVDAEMERLAAEQALTNFATARDKVGLPPWPVVHLDMMTEDRLDAELARPPFPDVVGVAEAAKLLGVSKQRLLQLTERDDFPAPMVRLAAGPVWLAASIRAFDKRWSRKPGRPARSKTIPPGGSGVVVAIPPRPGRRAASAARAVVASSKAAAKTAGRNSAAAGKAKSRGASKVTRRD
jgi:hypothetical protein